MASDRLSALPVELLTLVAAHLEGNDYAACRLTCRRIDAKLLRSFARDSFTTCFVMRTPESIHTLIDISKSRLSPFVKRLVVSAEVLCSTKRSHSGVFLAADQEEFISSGRDGEMLKEALLDLRWVRRVHIRNAPTFRGLSAEPADPYVTQRSLGIRKLLSEQEHMTGQGADREDPTCRGGSQSDRACLHATLLALSKANFRHQVWIDSGDYDV